MEWNNRPLSSTITNFHLGITVIIYLKVVLLKSVIIYLKVVMLKSICIIMEHTAAAINLNEQLVHKRGVAGPKMVTGSNYFKKL